MLQKVLLVLLVGCLSSFSFGQVMEFDMLEMKYNQGHYRMVYRKANRLIDNPEYDYSYLPRYYRAISILQLAQNDRWFNRNKHAVNEAKEILLDMKKTIEGRGILQAHAYEMSALKNDLKQWAGDLQIIGDRHKFRLVSDVLSAVFIEVPYVHDLPKDKDVKITLPEKTTVEAEKPSLEKEDIRMSIISSAKELIGTPYKWAGTTPDGFDCSGFTSYIFKEHTGAILERRSEDQFIASKKLKEKNVQPGDLVFFGNGGKISHVGIIVNTDNNKLEMIHSSTSIGISIIDINQSAYWKKRIIGFGTYL